MDTIVDPTNRLRIATRIHFALLRHYSEDVAVSNLLKGEADSREALWVCEASGIAELVALAEQFNVATREEVQAGRLRRGPAQVAAIPAATPQDLAWSQDTSGFGVSRPLTFLDTPAPSLGDWLRPSNWLRRSMARAAG